MKKQGFFCEIFVIGGISIQGARATSLATPMILDKIAPQVLS